MVRIDYGKIIKRSWQLTWNHKWLWVMGLVLATLSGSSGGSSNSVSNLLRLIPKDAPKDIPQQSKEVLGAASSIWRDWAAHVSPTTWVLLGCLIGIAVLFWIVVSWIAQSWAKGALVGGLQMADGGKNVTLVSSSQHGLAAWKRLIILQIISLLVTFGSIVGTLIIVGVGYGIMSFAKQLQIIWLALTIPVGGISLFILLLLVSMLGIYADRLVVLHNYPAWQAWKKALRLSQGGFIPTVLMGLVNQVMGCVAGCGSILALLVVTGIPLAILAIPLFVGGFHWTSWPVAIAMVLLVSLFVYANVLVRAVMVVFTYGNWNLFFEQMVKSEKHL